MEARQNENGNCIKAWIRGKIMLSFCLVCQVVLFVAAFCCDTPMGILRGMKEIFTTRDALITDYFVLGGYGAAFFNAALIFAIGIGLVLILRVPFTGLTMAALFINAGYGLWGKNPLNVMPILFGTWLYAKMHTSHMSRYVYTALFGTCLAPFVSEMVYILPFPAEVNTVCAVAIGIFLGFTIPPLSMHTASMHMGYNLFNVGFSGGIVAFIMVSVLRSFGLDCQPVMIWQEGRPLPLVIGLYGLFVLAVLWGLYGCTGDLKQFKKLTHHPGRAVADFVLMNGEAATIINMGLMGMIMLTYILIIGGDLSGPVVGTILAAMGFSAFGAHVKNYPPVLAGVFLFTFISVYTPSTPGIQLAALFAVGLAPIAGQFGVLAGIVAGALHSAIVMCTSGMYGGLNLYNNGFSAGWVAIIMIPILESFMKRFVVKKRKKESPKG